jgi:pimeloyl-ACP methyl ester carboxylesterase
MIRMFKAAIAVVVVVLSSSQVFAQAADAAHALRQYERRVLSGDIAEYTYTVRVGDGPYDEIGLHRVVRETAAGQPVRTERAVFLAPGDIWNFRAAFLTGAHPLPVFLAEQGVDVWGIDYRWTRVPATVTDGSFMQQWGIAQDASDLGVALRVARFARTSNGNPGRLFLLGWSRGGQIGYVYLAGEAQRAPGLRQVEGFIPVDIYVKTNVPQLQSFACQRLANSEALLASGQYANPVGGLVSLLGTLAQVDPNGPSILDPNLTNRQAGLLVGEATFALLGGLEPAPAYHFTGGVFDANGAPAGLLYSNEADLFSFETAASPVQPNRELADADAYTCGTASLNLASITVPVLYIGAGGGFGEFGIYTTTLLGSTDVSSFVVSKVPPAQRLFDYGHADLFNATDAQQQVWQPLLDWMNAR